ncbi:MAG: M23 family metallopeptidase [Pseudomonadota bacterium]
MQESPKKISRKDRGRLNGGLFSAIAMVALTVSGAGLASWYLETADQGQFGGVFEAEATTLSFSAETVATLPNLEVDFQDALPAKTVVRKIGTLRRNSTLNATLEKLGAERTEAATALQSLYDKDLLDPRRLRAGLKIEAHFDEMNGQLVAISLRDAPERGVLSKRLSDGRFFATDLNVQAIPTVRRIATQIESSIYQAALNDGALDQQVADFADIFAYDIDFQREIHPGDEFEIVYETFVDERGNSVRSGEVLYAALNGRALNKGFYRHTPEDTGTPDYFTDEGKSATRFLMRTPINGARLSSRFGRRRHPISGYTRMHKGTDFAAPRGTPIFAAGNGVVERASRYGGYGHYVRIQHANGYETAYAHLSRYGPRIRKGRRVRQGDVIGYVGSTGASTGPHLHYEVLVNGRHVNAMTLRLPTGRTLEGDLLEAFQTRRAEIDSLRLAQGAEIEVAALETAETTFTP